MQYNPYHLDHWGIAGRTAHGGGAGGSFALAGVLRSLVWLFVIAAVVVALAVGTQPQLLVKVLDLVLLFAAGSMVVCLSGLVLLNVSILHVRGTAAGHATRSSGR